MRKNDWKGQNDPELIGIPRKKGPLSGNANYYFGNIACVSFQISKAKLSVRL